MAFEDELDEKTVLPSDAEMPAGADAPLDDDEDEGDDDGTGKKRSPLKAIRQKCLDCSGGSWHEVSLCWAETCPLYPFRFGKNPFRVKRVLTEEQKEAARERFRLAREKKKQQEDTDGERKDAARERFILSGEKEKQQEDA